MNIALIDVDSRIPNAALMKLSAWHKQRGDTTKLHEPLLDSGVHFDHAYASKMFRFTDGYAYFPDCPLEKGGPGYGYASLDDSLDSIYPDYALYGCTHALGRITRGCPRRCDWCVVWRTDGNRVRQVAELDDFWRGQSHVRLLDDNLTADQALFVATCDRLAAEGVHTMFEALDIRFVDGTAARALARVKRWGRVHFAFDDPAHEPDVRRGVAALAAGGFPLWAATFYVLIGHTTEEQDTHRLDLLRSLGVESFVMPLDKTDPYQRARARHTNHKAVYKTVSWSEYTKRQRMEGAA